MLCAASVVHGQVIYREGPFGGQRFYVGSQGVAGGCYVGPGGQMVCGPNGCPGGPGGAQTIVQPPQVPAAGQAPRVGAAAPSPVVVRIASRRGDTTKWGSGALVDWRDGTALVLTCAHILQAGFEPSVIFGDRSQLPVQVLAADALHDCALLTVRVGKCRVIPLADSPPQAGSVYWAGWGQGVYGQTGGPVLGIDGDWLYVRGEPRNGDSGGPIYSAQGQLVAILNKGSQTDNEPWESSGPHVAWIRGFIALHWDKTSSDGVFTPPIDEAPLPLPAGKPRENPDLGQRELIAEVAALRKAVAALTLKAGPPGPPGPDGPAGPPGCPGKDADPAAVAELRAAVAVLQNRVDQPITFRTRRPDGTIIESSEVHLGQSQDLFLVPQRRSP